jgi:ATP-dependent Clp protease adaptor protein ClpS
MTSPNEDQAVLEIEQIHTEVPRLYRVLLLNDDYTPMDFVVGVLQRFFAMNKELATTVMLQVHREGQGLCGVYPRDIAATKVDQVMAWARQHQHPLVCTMEEENG